MNENVFPIGLWVPPSLTRERLHEVAECGFTVMPVPARSVEQGRQALDWLQEAGALGMIQDRRVNRDLPEQDGWESVVDEVVDGYRDHPALWGYYLSDEPHLRMFDNLGDLTKAFLERDPDHVPYINLFPNYAAPDQLGTIDYREHVRRFVERVRPPLLSYDNYSLMETGDRPEYFTNLEIIREEALRGGIPFMNIILSTPHFNYRDPSAEDMRWQVYTSLAYGAKAITYFTYKTPDVENYRNGPLSIYEKRTPKWEVLRELNTELQKLGPWLLRLTSTGIYHSPTAPAGTAALASKGVVAGVSDGDLLVGEFVDDKGLPWVMVTNKDREHSVFVTIRFKTEHRTLREVARSTGELRPIARDQGIAAGSDYADGMIASFWLSPGDGRLMRLGDRA